MDTVNTIPVEPPQAVDGQQLAVERLRAMAAEEAPGAPFVALFEALTKEELTNMARESGLTGYSRLNKAELAALVADAAVASIADNIPTLLANCPRPSFQTVRAVSEAGGAVSFDASEAPAYADWVPAEPLLNLYVQGDTFTFCIPQELRGIVGNVDWKIAEGTQLVQDCVVNCANATCELCGIVTEEELYAQFVACYDFAELDEDTFCRRLNDLASDFDRDPMYVLAELDDQIVVMAYTLSDEANEDASDDEKASLRGYRSYLLDSHRGLPVRPVDPAWKGLDGVIEWKLELPAARRLVAFLEGYAPEDSDAAMEAEGCVAELVADPGASSDPADQLAFLGDMGMPADDPDFARAATPLLRALTAELPCWELNGWSRREAQEVITGKKSFVDENGDPIKVGRNDPCPCGSGKKYKRCCGAASAR